MGISWVFRPFILSGSAICGERHVVLLPCTCSSCREAVLAKAEDHVPFPNKNPHDRNKLPMGEYRNDCLTFDWPATSRLPPTASLDFSRPRGIEQGRSEAGRRRVASLKSGSLPCRRTIQPFLIWHMRQTGIAMSTGRPTKLWPFTAEYSPNYTDFRNAAKAS